MAEGALPPAAARAALVAHVDAQGELRTIDAPSPAERFVTVFASGGATYALTTANAFRVEDGKIAEIGQIGSNEQGR